MTNKDVSRLLKNIAAVYTINKENRFKIIAYEKAADSIDHLAVDLKDLWLEGKLDTVPGIGKSIASHINDLYTTGSVKHFKSILSQVPPGVFVLMELPGFGPKKAYNLITKLNLIHSRLPLDDLKIAAQKGEIAKLEGFGSKSEQDILEAIETYKSSLGKAERMPLPVASSIADDLKEYLRIGNLSKIETLGSLRRRVSTIGDVDLAVATTDPEDILDLFVKYKASQKLIERGPEGATIVLHGGQHVDLRVIKPQGWGSMLQYFTGSKNHNIHLREYALKKGLSLNEYGIKNLKTSKITEFDTEESFYNYLGLDWIPPEIREDRGEIELSLKHKLPNLIESEDIHGDLQVHSSFPIEPSHDLGVNSMEELIVKAKDLKYQYIAFTEHNPSVSKHTENQIIDIMKRRKEYIEQIKYSTNSVRVLNLLEIDIDVNGNLSLPEKAFNYIDGALVSIHSSFTQPKDEMTARVLKGLSHPKAKIWAHPTARLINKREGISVDFHKIFQYCVDNNKAIEINSYPDRLDLPDALVYEALKVGVKFTLGTDAHDLSGMDMMPFGVSVARRGWATKNDILNTLSYNEIYSWLKKT